MNWEEFYEIICGLTKTLSRKLSAESEQS
jgi:hypothetical protein